jgi:hypothetical protein
MLFNTNVLQKTIIIVIIFLILFPMKKINFNLKMFYKMYMFLIFLTKEKYLL